MISKALTLYDGTVAAGGNRYETNTIAKYEFKTGTGTHHLRHQRCRAGAEPHAVRRRRAGSAAGASTSRPAARPRARPPPARSSPTASRPRANTPSRLWAAPANVAQEDAYIFSYSGGVMSRNVTLAQRAYQYEALARSQHHARQWRAGAADPRRGPRRAGLAAARGADLRPGQRPPPVRERQLHRRRGSARAVARWPTGTTPSRWCSATRPPTTASGRA